MGKIEKLTNSLRNQTGKEVKGMKKVLISLALAIVLVMAMAVPVMAAASEESSTASVTVTSYISSTITDAGDAGMIFGSLTPGTSDNEEVGQNGAGAINITVGAETNVACKIGAKGFNLEATTLARTNGTATGGSATTVVDSGATFTGDSIVAGDIVSNTGDNSYAVVTEVTNDTTVTHTTLNDGGAFANTETYIITASTSVTTGTSDGAGSTTELDDAAGDFVNNGVEVGDIVDDGTGTSLVTAVAATSLTVIGTIDFSGAISYTVRSMDDALGITNAKWDTDTDVAGATAMTPAYAEIASTTAGVETSQEVWHWLSVPNGQAAATYTGDWWYKADTSL